MNKRIAVVLVVLALSVSLLTLPVLADPAAPASSWTDDFDGPTLDSRWFWLNEDPTHWSLTARPGFMRILAQEGWKNYLLQAAPAVDYVIETRLLFEPTQNIQRAGLFLVQDGNNHLELIRAYCDFGPPGCPGNAIYFDCIEGGASVGSVAPMITVSTDEVYLRVFRRGRTYAAYVSEDGTHWTLMGTHVAAADFAPTAIGLMTNYTALGAGEIPADFDYVTLNAFTSRVLLPLIVR